MRDSTPVAFEVAGSLAVQEAAVKAGLIRLEPLAEVVVTAPESSVGAVLGELASRRAAVHGVVMESQQATVRASMPLVKTFSLRPGSGLSATFSWSVSSCMTGFPSSPTLTSPVLGLRSTRYSLASSRNDARRASSVKNSTLFTVML